MDTNTLLTWFIGFVFAALAINTVLIWIVGKALTGVATKVTATVHEIETGQAMRSCLLSLQDFSERAVTATNQIKVRLSEAEPAMYEMQERYEFVLAKIDRRVERITTNLSDTADLFHDAFSTFAGKFAKYSGRVTKVFASLYFPTED